MSYCLRSVASTPTWHAVDINHCLVVHRPRGAALEFKVNYTSLVRHLLKVPLSADGCGDADGKSGLAIQMYVRATRRLSGTDQRGTIQGVRSD